MNSDEIFDLIERISSTSSKKEKEGLIRQYGSDLLLQKVLDAGLNPFKTYGISFEQASNTAIAAAKAEGSNTFGAKTFDLLKSLERRELTGNAALNALTAHMGTLSLKSAELLARVVGKDFRAGFSESTVNKAIKGLIPTFDCMLAHPFEEKRAKWPMIVEPKLDGVRVLAFVSDSDVRFFTRSGNELDVFDAVKDEILDRNYVGAGSDIVLDGEMLTGGFNKTVSEVRRKGEQAKDAVFNIFDIMTTAEFFAGESSMDYIARRSQVEEFVKHCDGRRIQHLPKYTVNSVAEIHSIYRSVRERGLEGLIVKDPKAKYVCKRSHAWMKIKAEETADVPIVGMFEGTGKYQSMLGGLIVAFDRRMFELRTEGTNHDNENATYVSVGSGFSDDERRQFWELGEQMNGHVIEVEFHEITPDGSLRHPRFKRIRDDK